ncbi:aminoacyl-tRNA hydrolase [Corynebacterium felinum]|uniref:Peptidyl-tRNA hydrolase n=1 Tax=Corynebacterium felinum TaxID=131318 RepID=A0ABU2B933_9CORY|nr:aminoacyl-tRNA hydrolase [Corynebacterium felinum]MDF5821044.1 aminoacyl-tRNA hydrolase [Corynebacterium felinum]MDR7355126.1 PTH1 family peptidyl-tRNA hydrolase [Corynebacterium felinum]WJY94477.1 Peptidyl-tRNA hydrolase [Corynebacterium felinum]
MLWDVLKKLFSNSTPRYHRPEKAEWLIVGLGNPGADYAHTRHNVGYMVIDQLLEEHKATLQPIKGMPAYVAEASIGGTPTLLVRSTTYMNTSGEAVAALAQAYDIPADHIILIHDELDLPHGTVRLKKGGNENGHNGLKSTTALLGTRDYLRVRMGISRPPQGISVPDYVLGPITHDDALESMITTAAHAAHVVVTEGLSKAQNIIH